MRRTVRSYVLRQGRVTAAQERALAELMPVYGIEFKEALLQPATVFGREAPLVLEIGSGMGEPPRRSRGSDPIPTSSPSKCTAPGWAACSS